MAEGFITKEATNFVRTHYYGTMHNLDNPKPRYNVGDPKRRESNLSLFKGKLAPSGVGKPKLLCVEEWRTLMMYILNNLIEVRPYIK